MYSPPPQKKKSHSITIAGTLKETVGLSLKEYVVCKKMFLRRTSKINTSTLFPRGTKFLELPYVVKGMDVSFSGLLSYIEVSNQVSNQTQKQS